MSDSIYTVKNLDDKDSPWKKTLKTFTGKSEEGFWFINKVTRQLGVVKIPKERKKYEKNPEKYCGKYSGEHLAEKLASEIGLKLGLKMTKVDLAIYNKKKCCISYSFLNSEIKLREGNDFLTFEITKDRNRDKYTLKNILNDIREYNVVEDFIEMMLFDVLVGQTDRHERNWGILIYPNENYKFAPIYDNSSCLSREVHNYKHGINIKLDMPSHFSSYLKKARSIIRLESNKDNDLSHFEMLKHLSKEYNSFYNDFCNKLKKLSKETIKEIIWKIPDEFILDSHRRVILKIILERKNKILHRI